MKNVSILVVTALMSMNTFASELKDCEKKIAEILNQVNTSKINLIEDGKTNERVDSYHMSPSLDCGVELTSRGQLTVSMFKPSSTDRKKFETIILNGNDPTYTDGRVKALVSCSIENNTVIYTTKVPVLTDGVKSPYAVEKLTIKQEDSSIQVSLRATVTPIHKVFRSITDCTLEVK
jgi:hypothetical protein